MVKLSRAPGVFTLGQQIDQTLRDRSGKENSGVQLVVAISIEQEVLLQRLITVERLAYVRDGRVEILFHHFEICLAPEGIDDLIFRRPVVTP